MAQLQHEHIFKNGSKTYYFSSRFFPPKAREDVFILYAFVRIADNLVDDQPVDPKAFFAFRTKYTEALATSTPCGDAIIDNFIALQARKNFDPKWTEAFLDSMQHDLEKTSCDTQEEVLAYIYGSAEVIGYFMARIMDLPDKAFPYAAMLGRAMQYINFIRDIDEDVHLGRRYLPLGDSPLTDLTQKSAESQPEAFSAFIRDEITRYQVWQKEASLGYRLIPRRFRIPIMTAADMYCWTARKIYKDPFMIFQRKVKPPKSRIIRKGFAHTLGVALPCKN